MNNIHKLTLFITNICNAKCEHCYVNPLFGERQIMSTKLLNECIDTAIDWNIKRLALTGGEPILFWDKISKSIEKLNNTDIQCSISTNAYWADSNEHAYKLILEMKSKGVNFLELSTDKYHQKFIPIENIIRCVKYSQDIGMSFIVRVCGENTTDEVRTLSVLSSILKNKNELVFQYTANYGQAKKSNIHSHLDFDLLKNVKCNQIGQPIIMYNRDIYACCGPSISLSKKDSLYLGKFDKKNSNVLFKKITNSNFIKQLQQFGPSSLMDNCKKEYSSLCELCHDAMNGRNNLI